MFELGIRFCVNLFPFVNLSGCRDCGKQVYLGMDSIGFTTVSLFLL